MLLFRFHPVRNVFDEARLGQRLTEKRFEFGRDCGSIDGARLFPGNSADRLLLDKFPLQCIYGRQRVMSGVERACFRRNPE